MDEIPWEASPEDVIEQRAEVVPAPASAVTTAVPWDADPADVADQLVEVPLDDDWM